MEIERKYFIETPPDDFAQHPFCQIEQAYLCTSPVVRIRREDDSFYLTYKSKGLLSREEHNLPLDEASYLHLLEIGRHTSDSSHIATSRMPSSA